MSQRASVHCLRRSMASRYAESQWGPRRSIGARSGAGMRSAGVVLKRDYGADKRLHGAARGGGCCSDKAEVTEHADGAAFGKHARSPARGHPLVGLRARAQGHAPTGTRRAVSPRRLDLPVLRGAIEPDGEPCGARSKGGSSAGRHRRLLRTVQSPQGQLAAAPGGYAAEPETQGAEPNVFIQVASPRIPVAWRAYLAAWARFRRRRPDRIGGLSTASTGDFRQWAVVDPDDLRGRASDHSGERHDQSPDNGHAPGHGGAFSRSSCWPWPGC